ncbi:hypothetical protein [Acinetobacter lactucae]|uniref:hypothetical protein n=1 Tax=Acinetobacter lactucae TaxID=1785128 RepID=UPI0015F5BC04|nr:hypothetical protein [Acinetobacter lactucae]
MNTLVDPDRNSSVELYIERPVVYIPSENFAEINSLPEYEFRNLIVIAMNSKGTKSWLDYGSLCYKNKTKVNNQTHAAKVVELSLDKNLEAVFDLFIRSKLSRCASITARSYHWRLKAFTKYYFEFLENFNFNDYNQCCKAYEEYTQVLLIEKARLMASDSQKGSDHLAKKQTIFAELICLLHNKNLINFKASFVTVKGHHSTPEIKPVSDDKLTFFYEINKRIFLALKDFLMKNKNFPFVFQENIIDETIVHYPTDGFLRTFKKFYFDQSGYIVDKEELEKRISLIDIDKVGKMSLKGYKSFVKKYYETTLKKVIEESNDYKSVERARLINYAFAAFSMCFFCESSINPAQLYTLKYNDLSDYKPSIKGFRVLIIKPRANYKSTELYLSVKMLPLKKEFEEFREWVLSLVSNNKTDKIFISLETKNSTSKSFEIIKNFSGKNITNYRRWLSLYMPNFEWIIPPVIRKTISNHILTITDSTIEASKKLGNTPKLIASRYSEVTDHQYSEQLTEFFNHVYSNIENKYRKNNKIIKVNINMDGKKTPIGSCVNPVPILNSGFSNDMEKPNCSNPASCLFCKNYVVHSDREDIKKLMSLKKIINISDQNEEKIIVTRRINEILKILLEKYPETQETFFSVAKSVESGDFDEYWQDHLDLLIELGANFYE